MAAAASSAGPSNPPLIAESEPPTPLAIALADELLELMRRADEIDRRINEVKAQLTEEAPLGTRIDMGDVQVIRSERRPFRKLNVVGLLKRGVPREAFSTIRPSVTVFTEWAEKENWPEATRDMYILPGGDPVPTVLVRPTRTLLDDDYQEEA